MGFSCAGVVAAWLLLGLTPKPRLMNRGGFSQAVYDRSGKLLRISLSSDEKYRLWTSLEEIPPEMLDATLLQEDRLFYLHYGVNPFSLLRGAVSTYLRRTRRIGGSTITMQVARMLYGIRSRTLFGKLEQIARAVQLERHYSKQQILEAYLNLAPYGGNVEGAGAASIIYFGKEVRTLSEPEILTLTVIPQSPAARKPGKQGEELREARARLAASAGTPGPALLNVTAARRHPFEAPHLVDRVLAEHPFLGRIRTTLDSEMQKLLERRVSHFVERNTRLGMKNACALLVHYPSMEVRGYVGSADFPSVDILGQVDGIRAHRSPGSALKPFIYGLALDAGIIHPKSVLSDTQQRISMYNPENFDREFLGPLPADEALVRSRNLPAVYLSNHLPEPGLYGLLKKAGVKNLKPEGFYGLAVALGGVEVSMEEVAQLYAVLANGGELRPVRYLLEKSPLENYAAAPSATRLFSPEASYLVLEMLRLNPRPRYDLHPGITPHRSSIPWKTGTSFGFRDAWAAGFIGEYVLVTWVGNFDGSPNANFIGRDASGPLFFSIAESLEGGLGGEEHFVHGDLNIKREKVCTVSGALPGPHCEHLTQSWFIPGVSPIKSCEVHREVEIDEATGLRSCAGSSSGNTRREVYEFWPSDVVKLFKSAGISRRLPPPDNPSCRVVGKAPLISTPTGRLQYVRRGNEESVIPFSAVTDGDTSAVFWFVGSELVGRSKSGESFFWHSRPGSFTVRAVDMQGRGSSVPLEVMVTE